MTRERALAEAFVDLSDTLVSDYDLTELAYKLVDHCVSLLNVAHAGLLLSDQRGALQVVACSSEQTRVLELLQLQVDQGPCVDCVRSGTAVAAILDGDGDRWPVFTEAALALGYTAVHALPLRLRRQTLGAVNLFLAEHRQLDGEQVHMAQALADIATIGILQHRAIADRDTVIEQLEGALHSRVVIEQAKGVLAERGGMDPDEAFGRMRAHARHRGLTLTSLAQQIVADDAVGNDVLAGGDTRLTPSTG